MFSDWSYSQTFRAIGQSLEEIGVQDFSLSWRDDKFVVRGTRSVAAKRGWFAALFKNRPKDVNKKIELHYLKKSILWLEIRGEGMRKRPDQMPDYFRLSQTLRTVGAYVDNMTLKFLVLTRNGGVFTLEFQQSDGHKRVEEHGVGSFETYFLHTYLSGRKKSQT